jgi:hypothetical protein
MARYCARENANRLLESTVFDMAQSGSPIAGGGNGA